MAILSIVAGFGTAADNCGPRGTTTLWMPVCESTKDTVVVLNVIGPFTAQRRLRFQDPFPSGAAMVWRLGRATGAGESAPSSVTTNANSLLQPEWLSKLPTRREKVPPAGPGPKRSRPGFWSPRPFVSVWRSRTSVEDKFPCEDSERAGQAVGATPGGWIESHNGQTPRTTAAPPSLPLPL